MVAAAVVLPPNWCPEKLDDSKKLTAPRREKLCGQIMASALSWGACAVSAPQIDKINILQATLQAMARSLAKLDPVPDLALIDGLQTPSFSSPCQAVTKGDSRSAAIAAASVIAKVLRDRVMAAYERHYPGYGFARNKGYGAAAHRQALEQLGPCSIHRFSYRPVADRQQKLF